MDEKDLGELRELVEFLKQNGIAQFEMERADLKVKLKFASAFANADTPGIAGTESQLQQFPHVSGVRPPLVNEVASGPDDDKEEEVSPDAGLHFVKSPLVGTFYEASSPGAEPFVKVGDRVTVGQVLCIVEAMKLMNEVEADTAGEIIKVFAAPGQPVEYGQQLFAIR